MTVIDLGTGKAPRRRSQDTADRLAVRLALSEVVRVITDLRSKGVLLNAQLQKTPELSDQAARIVDLQNAVRAASERFDAIVRSLPEGQRHHSQVIDVDRALVSLASSCGVSDRCEALMPNRVARPSVLSADPDR